MRKTEQSWAGIDQRWQWMKPSGEWLLWLLPEVVGRASEDDLPASEVIELVQIKVRRMVALLLARHYGAWSEREIDDVTQDVFVRIAERRPLERWSSRKGTRMGWFRGIIRHVVREWARQRRRSQFEEIEIEPPDPISLEPDAMAEQADLVETVKRWTKDLTDKRRGAVLRGHSAFRDDPSTDGRAEPGDSVNKSRGLSDLRERALRNGLMH